MSPQTGIVNKTQGRRARISSSKSRDPKSRRTASLEYRGLRMAEKSDPKASSKSLSLEEITAGLIQLESEMAERKPQRGSSKRKILKKKWVALKRLERGGAELRARIHRKAKLQEKELEELEAEKEGMRVLKEWLNPLLASHEVHAEEEVFANGSQPDKVL